MLNLVRGGYLVWGRLILDVLGRASRELGIIRTWKKNRIVLHLGGSPSLGFYVVELLSV